MTADGQCVFSPDGSMFATVTGHRGTINLFDFDRCSGILSNQRAIHVPRLPVDSGLGVAQHSGYSLFAQSKIYLCEWLYQYHAI
ncbi:MAG: hypothetical protein R2831_07555 [Chitinophagaceae bacterium]